MPAKKTAKKKTTASKKMSSTTGRKSRVVASPVPAAIPFYSRFGTWGIIVAAVLFLSLGSIVAGYQGYGPLSSIFQSPSVNKVVEYDPSLGLTKEQKAQNAAVQKVAIEEKKKENQSKTSNVGGGGAKVSRPKQDVLSECQAKRGQLIPSGSCAFDEVAIGMPYADSNCTLSGDCVHPAGKCCISRDEIQAVGDAHCKTKTVIDVDTKEKVDSTQLKCTTSTAGKLCVKQTVTDKSGTVYNNGSDLGCATTKTRRKYLLGGPTITVEATGSCCY